MKALFLSVLLATVLIGNAQEPKAVALSKAEAIREFPALGEQGSDFNKRFVERFNSLKTARDSLLLRDDWPEVLAKEIGVELGADPIMPVAPAAATPTASPTPWQPMGTMLDPHPSDGSVLDQDSARGKEYFVAGVVVRQSPDGLLILCTHTDGVGYEAVTGEVWLVGKEADVGKSVKTAAIKLGTFKYPPSGRIGRMLDKYQAEQ